MTIMTIMTNMTNMTNMHEVRFTTFSFTLPNVICKPYQTHIRFY